MSLATLDAYSELLLEHKPAIPRNAREHRRMVAVLEAIDLAVRKPSKDEQRFADLVAAAILVYEDQQCPPAAVAPNEALVQLMANRKMSLAELAQELGASAITVGQLCRGEKKFSKGLATQLAQIFAIEAGVFLA